jgi:nitrite reductase (NADH) small subunit
VSASSWVRACAVDEIPARGGRLVQLGAIEVGVFRTGHGAILAVANRCPHRGGPLSEGIITDHTVICPLHGWKLDLVTGAACAPDVGCVTRFPVDVRGREVWIDAATRPREVPPIEDVTGVHADTGRPRLGRRRAAHDDFTLYDFERPIPVLAVEPPSPDSAASLRLRLTRGESLIAEYTLDDLVRLCPTVTQPAHLTCLMFGFTRPVAWRGVRLCDVLAAVEPPPFVTFYSWNTSATREGERFFETLPRAYALDPRTLLAFDLNDAPLPKEHGGPLRLVVPFLQGYKSVKWLTEIALRDDDEVGYKKRHGFIEFPEFTPPADWKPGR